MRSPVKLVYADRKKSGTDTFRITKPNRSRREPRPDEVELQDVVIGEVSIEPLLSSDDWRVLENELFEAANDMWRGDASEHADRLREERRVG